MFLDEAGADTEFYGTVGFAAPELYCKNPIDERSDVYGIGMLLYFMATGKILELGKGSLEHIDFATNIQKNLKKIICRCLKYNPSQRYASVKHLEKDLTAIGKKKYIIKTGSSIEIGIAGAQPRIGTTHMAIRLCNYFINNNISCLYIEQNNSRCIWRIQNRYFDLKKYQDLIKYKGIPVTTDLADLELLSDCNIIIKDYGTITSGNREEFLKSKIKILVLGAKDWELGYSEDAIEILAEYKDVIFLFNFVDGKQFGHIMNYMPDRICMRIPYEPDPFAMPKDRVSREFFRELAGLCTEEATD